MKKTVFAVFWLKQKICFHLPEEPAEILDLRLTTKALGQWQLISVPSKTQNMYSEERKCLMGCQSHLTTTIKEGRGDNRGNFYLEKNCDEWDLESRVQVRWGDVAGRQQGISSAELERWGTGDVAGRQQRSQHCKTRGLSALLFMCTWPYFIWVSTA